MSWETYTGIAANFRAYLAGARFSLSFSGMGEPLLHPDIHRFINHVAQDATTSFATNAALLTAATVKRLIAAGLDVLYISFNGDESAVFEQMMGRVRFASVLEHTRGAVELARGTRLQIRANISLTKVNQDRLSRTRTLLESLGVGPIAVSLCHNRGGSLRDPAVCDTPAMGDEPWPCDVLRGTLFVDWRGRVFICDHDLHGEYPLGDATREPLALILARRHRLLAAGMPPAICRQCNDVMRLGNMPPLASGAGGIFRDWVERLYRDEPETLTRATAPMRWIFRIYAREQRLDRLVNELLAIEQSLQSQVAAQAHELAVLRRRVAGRKSGRWRRLVARLVASRHWANRPQRACANRGAGVVL